MVAHNVTDDVPRTGDGQRRLLSRVYGPHALALMLTIATALLVVDAMARPLAPFDLRIMRAVQRIDLPLVEQMIWLVDPITSSEGAIAMWAAALLAFVGARWWLPVLAISVLPVGGLINHAIGDYLVDRTRPDGLAHGLERGLADVDAPTFPSGHVMGAVMLYGLLVFIARRMKNRPFALTIQAISIVILVAVGFDRIWVGAHWPSDVLAAYTLGGLILLGIIVVYQRIEAAVGDPTYHDAVGLLQSVARIAGRANAPVPGSPAPSPPAAPAEDTVAG